MRHRIDRSRSRGTFASIASGDRERISNNRLDDEAIGSRRQAVTDAEVDVKDAELEIRYGEQSVLLTGKLGEITDLAEVGVIFEAGIEVLAELTRDPRGRCEVRFAVFSEADVDNRVNDELIFAVADADDGADLQGKAGLRKGRRLVAEFEVDAVEEAAFGGIGDDEQAAGLAPSERNSPVPVTAANKSRLPTSWSLLDAYLGARSDAD